MKSSELFAEARNLMPGGVSSPVRAISPYPFYTEKASGARLTTVEGTTLIDCCMAYGPLILGHTHPEVRKVLAAQLREGWVYGTPSLHELELARLITADHPSVDMIRFVSSGSDATMSALRLARGFTGKQDIVKAEGGFHGAHDAVLVKAGSGATTLGVPDSAGVLPDVARHTLSVPFNDVEALSAILTANADVAAVILEPVMGNIGPILPEKEYLAQVRSITREHGVLLIFDEVITGYRVGIGGAQRMCGVKPDLSTFGKIIGGGLPIGALGGRREIMSLVAPAGPVYQAGTFNGNPLSLTSGLATLRILHRDPSLFRRMEEGARAIGESVPRSATGSFVRLGSMFKYFFRSSPPRDYRQAKECDTAAFRSFWEGMLRAGIFLPPSQFETNFLSAAHGEEEIQAIAGEYASCLSG
ncbi:MAG: glutamate-1-semialdehyde 2,1-aminomutase [Methanomicrobiales archaeon]|nr:glutamate-1-semialdehyde 2,1-aminomutase [Methanomicrobiales archaeon]MDD1654404.1 glutamate-1-semialdehyde 2,1-aminomutase [Methanomicrobiales archaeon]